MHAQCGFPGSPSSKDIGTDHKRHPHRAVDLNGPWDLRGFASLHLVLVLNHAVLSTQVLSEEADSERSRLISAERSGGWRVEGGGHEPRHSLIDCPRADSQSCLNPTPRLLVSDFARCRSGTSQILEHRHGLEAVASLCLHCAHLIWHVLFDCQELGQNTVLMLERWILERRIAYHEFVKFAGAYVCLCCACGDGGRANAWESKLGGRSACRFRMSCRSLVWGNLRSGRVLDYFPLVWDCSVKIWIHASRGCSRADVLPRLYTFSQRSSSTPGCQWCQEVSDILHAERNSCALRVSSCGVASPEERGECGCGSLCRRFRCWAIQWESVSRWRWARGQDS